MIPLEIVWRSDDFKSGRVEQVGRLPLLWPGYPHRETKTDDKSGKEQPQYIDGCDEGVRAIRSECERPGCRRRKIARSAFRDMRH